MLHIPSWNRVIWHILERSAMVDEFRVLHVWLNFQIHLSVRVTCIVRQTVVDRASDTGRKAGVEVFFYVKIAYAVRIGILDTQRKIFESISFCFCICPFAFLRTLFSAKAKYFVKKSTRSWRVEATILANNWQLSSALSNWVMRRCGGSTRRLCFVGDNPDEFQSKLLLLCLFGPFSSAISIWNCYHESICGPLTSPFIL